MTLWLVRAGQHGEHEQRFLDQSRVYVTWDGLNYDLAKLDTKQDLQELLRQVYPDAPNGRIIQNSGQIWPFAYEMAPGDWVVVPSKTKPAIHIAEITGPYVYEASAEDPYYHHHEVKWIATDIPRSNFDQDLRYSFGAFLTICRVKRNNAEERVRAMHANGWRAAPLTLAAFADDDEHEPEALVDLEELARDEIAMRLIQRFKGHDMERLIDAMLRAQGYTTHRSPAGPDRGVDILAAPGPLGFGTPRLCVQVKSGDSPVDRPTLTELIGAMQNVQAEQGLLVSWGGFKSSVDKEVAAQFFRVRLWDRDTIIRELLAVYDELDEELKAELPLKQIWTIAAQDASG